jgi:hypothetical protein
MMKKKIYLFGTVNQSVQFFKMIQTNLGLPKSAFKKNLPQNKETHRQDNRLQLKE